RASCTRPAAAGVGAPPLPGHFRRRPSPRPGPRWLTVALRRLPLPPLLLGLPEKLVLARLAAEQIPPPADHLRELRVGLRPRDRADPVAELRAGVVFGLHPLELLRRDRGKVGRRRTAGRVSVARVR